VSTITPRGRAILVDDPPEPFAAWQLAQGLEPEAIVAAIEDSGLAGRGGAGFPTGRKLRLAREAEGHPKRVVVNGAEDEPGSGKDQFLLRRLPELVIEGALIVARAIGAGHVVFYLSEVYPESAEALRSALARSDAALTGADMTATVVLSPPTYVAGEDSAALEVIEGREPLPREKPPYPVTTGLYGLPTVVLNTETVAAAARIVVNGADWYRSLGTPRSRGTMLFTLGPEMTHPGVYELELGTPLRELLEDCGGGLASGEPFRFVLPGGPSSGFLTADQLDVPLTHDALRDLGSAIGCGVVRAWGTSACVVEVLDELMGFFQRESCGQCPPCRMETGLLARLVGQIKAGNGNPELVAKLPEVLEFAAAKGGLCSFISMPGPPVRSALDSFPGDFAAHLETGACPPGLNQN
jgi:NADH:ubiquinone oxidoreductase subunit F (NADH-binding)